MVHAGENTPPHDAPREPSPAGDNTGWRGKRDAQLRANLVKRKVQAKARQMPPLKASAAPEMTQEQDEM